MADGDDRQTTTGRERIILFSRYPRPGHTKTRLIAQLGPMGAARLQRRMTLEILDVISRLQARRPVDLCIYYTGGSRQSMEKWLGRDLLFQKQEGTVLGSRMFHALVQEKARGADRLLLLGSDCPTITPTILARGLDCLDRVDLVLGPAYDGGYYLIGMGRHIPANTLQTLFTEISWGGRSVYRQTMARAQEGALSVCTLPALPDIDRPEDLVYLDHHSRSQ